MKPTRITALIAIVVLAGCKPTQEEGETVPADTLAGPAMQHDSAMMGGMQQHMVMTDAQHDSMMKAMQNMSGDVQFLGMMTNHHTGLIAMAEQAMNKATDDSVKSAAHSLYTKQQKDNDEMMGMMKRLGMAQHQPMMMMKNKTQLDSLSAKSGKDYDRYFLQTVIKHHEEGIGMIDEFMPKMKDAQAKQMAERMKADQRKEIQDLQGKLKSL